MEGANLVSTPLANHFRLSKEQCPMTQQEYERLAKVPYASAVGSLMYDMVCTRPDIAHAIRVVSRFMSNLGEEHRKAIKWILSYLRGTIDTTLCYGDTEISMQGYVGSDLVGDHDSRKSTTRYVFTLDNARSSWASQLQKVVALSTTEAE